MALYIPHSIFNLARLLYVRPETFGPYYVQLLDLVTCGVSISGAKVSAILLKRLYLFQQWTRRHNPVDHSPDAPSLL